MLSKIMVIISSTKYWFVYDHDIICKWFILLMAVLKYKKWSFRVIKSKKKKVIWSRFNGEYIKFDDMKENNGFMVVLYFKSNRFIFDEKLEVDGSEISLVLTDYNVLFRNCLFMMRYGHYVMMVNITWNKKNMEYQWMRILYIW